MRASPKVFTPDKLPDPPVTRWQYCFAMARVRELALRIPMTLETG